MPERLQYLALHLDIRGDVPTGRRHANVPEVVPNHGEVDAGLQERDGATVTENVGADPAPPQRWQLVSRAIDLLGEQVRSPLARK